MGGRAVAHHAAARPAGGSALALRDLGTDLYGRPPAGKERQLIRASILRLFGVEVALTGYDTIERRAGANLCSLTRLFAEIATERYELNPADPFYRPGALEPTITGALRVQRGVPIPMSV